ncbi:hypothetical protein BHT74_09390, partial [Campylobacter jejuni]|nr:hypothetical protein [Campylobacter jejuni]
ENILKTTEKNGKHYPRLTTKIENVYIGINPQKIELFLDDLIKTFDERILKYCQDKIRKVGHKESLEFHLEL